MAHGLVNYIYKLCFLCPQLTWHDLSCFKAPKLFVKLFSLVTPIMLDFLSIADYLYSCNVPTVVTGVTALIWPELTNLRFNPFPGSLLNTLTCPFSFPSKHLYLQVVGCGAYLSRHEGWATP